MTNLTTPYLGMTLKSPLVVSANPLSDDLGNIRKMEDAGASAVVLYSLFEEQIEMEQRELHHHLTYGTDSHAESLTYFPEPAQFLTTLDRYLALIANARKAVDIPIIASLNGNHTGGWTHFARQLEKAGASALELNIYNIPTDFNQSGADIETEYIEILKAVKKEVMIPVAVKLSPFFSNMANMAKKLTEAGADGLVLFNRFYQPDVDLENLEVYPHVLLSTAAEMRLPLRWIAILYGRISGSLAATTGIHDSEDVLKMLMVGADVTMMASAVIRHGIDHLRGVEAGLTTWMESHEYESVAQMRGSMSHLKGGNAGAFERAQYVRAVSSLPKLNMA
jgi:dihydroorotate dehydrogenase (fumarate)